MKITENTLIKFSGENTLGEQAQLVIRGTNRGEPYRQGIEFDLDSGDRNSTIFLEGYEAKKLRDLLLRLYPI